MTDEIIVFFKLFCLIIAIIALVKFFGLCNDISDIRKMLKMQFENRNQTVNSKENNTESTE